MKKIIPLLMLLSLVAASVSALTFDLKVHLQDTAQLTPLKVGAEYFLMKAGHTVFDAGEDYAVWLKDAQVTRAGNTATVTVTVKLTETAALKEKESLAETKVTFTYTIQPKETLTTDEAATKFIRSKLQKKTAEAMEMGKVGGAAVAQAILALADSIRK